MTRLRSLSERKFSRHAQLPVVANGVASLTCHRTRYSDEEEESKCVGVVPTISDRLWHFLMTFTTHPLWHFFVGFIKDPVMVGSAIPSSRWTMDKLLAPVDWTKCKLFVEYGPGVGNFTERVLQRMAPDATLIAIDTCEDFTAYLNRQFNDSRLKAITGSAADVRDIIKTHGFEHADYILSGVPFSTLPSGVGPKIAEETHAALRSGGTFLIYQFKSKVLDFIEPHFRRIHKSREWVNIPPCHLIWCYKE